MMRALTTAGTGMIAQQINLDTISNNLANVNTTGYKHERAEFQDLIYQTFRGASNNSGAIQVGLGSALSATGTDFSQGAPQNTGNPLDLMINGNGFFQVQKPDGTLAYTRDGSFKEDANGQIVTSDGYLLDPPITIPTNATSVSVSPDGTVVVTVPGQNDPQQLGPIQVALFPNAGGLTRVGQNLYIPTGASGTAQLVDPGTSGAGPISSGFLEGSNVQVVEEMVKMIMAQRAYEINSKAIQTSDDMLSTINNLKR
ncbi:MAG TPA: flagellar basal-body rod protein FlgG [Fimbriimonadaceae bacterium]|nr:flagellar basal-body rod protein FlgG [Fimbriimonadaceae bacterium]